MSKIKQIDILSPCAANWQDMVPQNGGRHCHSCNKMVMDFTAMPGAKIIEYLSQHKSVCGQFYSHQLIELNRSLVYDRRIHLKWRRLMAAACVAGLLSVVKAEARPVRPTEQASSPKKGALKMAEDFTMILKGKVIDKTSGMPLKYATIYVNTTDIKTKTDELGEFVFMVPVNTSYLGVFAESTGPITISVTSTNPKYLGIDLSPMAYKLVINTFLLSDNRVIMGEIRTKPGQKFNKEKLIKIRTAKEIGAIRDFDEEKIKKPIISIQTLFADWPFINI